LGQNYAVKCGKRRSAESSVGSPRARVGQQRAVERCLWQRPVGR